MKKSLRLFALALLLPVFASCGDATSPEEEGITGTYTLQTVSNNPLPAVLEEGQYGPVMAHTILLTLREGGVFTTDEMYQAQSGDRAVKITQEKTGTWQRNGDTVSFSQIQREYTGDWVFSDESQHLLFLYEEGTSTYVAQLGEGGLTLTFNEQELTWVFAR